MEKSRYKYSFAASQYKECPFQNPQQKDRWDDCSVSLRFELQRKQLRNACGQDKEETSTPVSIQNQSELKPFLFQILFTQLPTFLALLGSRFPAWSVQILTYSPLTVTRNAG